MLFRDAPLYSLYLEDARHANSTSSALRKTRRFPYHHFPERHACAHWAHFANFALKSSL
jgi:hypothetical protein